MPARIRERFEWLGQQGAQHAVEMMIKAGRLSPARDCLCADCGAPAVEYEHRDYNEPETVEPICRGCNLRRGPAIPLRGATTRLVESGRIPYRLRSNAHRILVALGRPTDVLDDMPAKLTAGHWIRIAPLIDAA